MVMRTFADLHTHLMPCVDDGSQSLELSVRSIADMAAAGTRHIAVTPHVNEFFDPALNPDIRRIAADAGWSFGGVDPLTFVPDGFAALQQAVHAAGIDVTLHQGGELNPHAALAQTEKTLECIALGPCDNPWILMEVDLFSPFDETWSRAADYLRSFGYGIVLAHPERAPNMSTADAQRRLHDEIDRGVRCQVNAPSLLHDGSANQRVALQLLRDGLIYTAASDLHPGSRPWLTTDLLDGPAAQIGIDDDTIGDLIGRAATGLLLHGIAE